MKGRGWVVAAVVAAAALAPGAEVAGGGEGPPAGVRARVSTLEAEVAELRGDWTTRIRAEEIRSLVDDVLADADARAGLQGQGLCAGHDKHFFVASGDGSFRLSLLGQVQCRYVASVQEDANGADTTRGGFEVSRTRFGFVGHVVDPSWKYVLWAGWTGSGRSVLIDASLEKDLGEGWSVQVGQFKLPVWKEWLVFEGFQQFIERSLLNARYGGLAAQGIAVRYKSDRVRLTGAYTDGGQTWFTGWSAGPERTSGVLGWPRSNEWSLTVRGEALVWGEWGCGGDYESWPGDEPTFVLGAAGHHQRGEYGTNDEESELAQWTVDGSLELGGANLYGAVIGTFFDGAAESRHEWGVLVQGGVFLDEHWELIGRFEWGDMDGGERVHDELAIVTAGLSWFRARSALKWTVDVGYGFSAVDAQWGGTGAGWRADAGGVNGQMVIRGQVQVLF